MTQTELDKAYRMLTEKADQASLAAYYEQLMATELWVPVSAQALATVEDGEATGEPMEMLAFQDDDGITTILAFDTEQRLTTWADGREQPFAALRGEALFLALGGGEQQVALNVGTDEPNLISTAQCKWIYERLSDGSSQRKLAAGAEFRIGVPADVPAGLTAALVSAFGKAGTVEVAYLFGMQDDGDDGEFRIVIGIKPKTGDAAVADDIVAVIRNTVDGLDGRDLPVMDFLLMRDGDDISDAVRETIEPFYPPA
jgi:hypothetical protein